MLYSDITSTSEDNPVQLLPPKDDCPWDFQIEYRQMNSLKNVLETTPSWQNFPVTIEIPRNSINLILSTMFKEHQQRKRIFWK